ncbi:hypothetical protein N5C70_27415 [Pseudomonas juntendi]|uniref:Uncharacterized protein n=1 Tax=Pseudomonas juntendi TaxID=2666183 RepID=A0ABD4YMJ7_9PSED|nr:hypothetical protein [Pseudomonas juntendi]MDH0760394.1 hypothetical protein [Pseudomonas juntendi]MDH1917849.1 hypothetical protein [Pseudomonas juntendi]
MKQITPAETLVVGSTPFPSGPDYEGPLTLTSVEDVRGLFEGLCAVVSILELGAAANAAFAVTPSVLELLKHVCGDDPRFARVSCNLNVVSRLDMFDRSIYRTREPAPTKIGLKEVMSVRILGVPLVVVLSLVAGAFGGLIGHVLSG